MNFKFFSGTPVATINGILTDEECIVLHDYAVKIKSGETEESRAKMMSDCGYSESRFVPDPSLDIDFDKLKDSWGSKNVHTRFAPKHIQKIVKKLNQNLIPVVEEYLRLIDNPKKFVDPDKIQFDPIHVYSAGHSLEKHVDRHEFALVFYVSNPDQFTGGELVYEAGPRIVPSRGVLVISPSELTHEVCEVTDGFRCSLTNFFSASESASKI